MSPLSFYVSKFICKWEMEEHRYILFSLLFRMRHPYPIMLQTQLPMNNVLENPVLLFRFLTRSIQSLEF